jgi:hypothetical protein
VKRREAPAELISAASSHYYGHAGYDTPPDAHPPRPILSRRWRAHYMRFVMRSLGAAPRIARRSGQREESRQPLVTREPVLEGLGSRLVMRFVARWDNAAAVDLGHRGFRARRSKGRRARRTVVVGPAAQPDGVDPFSAQRTAHPGRLRRQVVEIRAGAESEKPGSGCLPWACVCVGRLADPTPNARLERSPPTLRGEFCTPSRRSGERSRK